MTTNEGVTFYKGGDGYSLPDENAVGRLSDIPGNDYGERNPAAPRATGKTADFQGVDTEDGTPTTAFDAKKPILWQEHPIPGNTQDVLVSPMDKMGDAFPEGSTIRNSVMKR
jgi:hypothetical protein